MEQSLLIKILGDPKGGVKAFDEVAAAGQAAAHKIQGVFEQTGHFLKKTIGYTAFGVGIERAVESASSLVNLQKVQAQLLNNQGLAQQYLVTVSEKGVKPAYEATRWYSKKLDQMATELSIQNGIGKANVVQAQTNLLNNNDLLKLYKGHHGALKDTLNAAANISEVMGGGHGSITSGARMLGRLMADPARRMSTLYRMGIQLSVEDQRRIKQAQALNGLQGGQIELLKVLNKNYAGVAAAAASPIERLRNDFSLLYQSLGLGILPIFEKLAKAMEEPVQALIPVLQFMGTFIEEVASKLGTSLGTLFANLTPVFQLFTNSLIPALLDMVTPFVQMITAVVTPLAQAFQKIVGDPSNPEKLGVLAKLFTDIGNQIAENLQPAIDAVSNSFSEMAKNGELDKFMQSLVQAFTTLAPILPALAQAFSDLVIAFLPYMDKLLPAVAFFLNVAAKLISVLIPLVKVAAGVVKGLAGAFKPFAGVIAGLLALWFTRKLFILPILTVLDGIKKIKTAIATIRTAGAVGALQRLAGAFLGVGGGGGGGAGGGGAGGGIVGGIENAVLNNVSLPKKGGMFSKIFSRSKTLKGGFAIKGIAGEAAGAVEKVAGSEIAKVAEQAAVKAAGESAVKSATTKLAADAAKAMTMSGAKDIVSASRIENITKMMSYSGAKDLGLIPKTAEVASKAGRFGKLGGLLKGAKSVASVGKIAGAAKAALGIGAVAEGGALLAGGAALGEVALAALGGPAGIALLAGSIAIPMLVHALSKKPKGVTDTTFVRGGVKARKYHSGGIVAGPRGSEVPAILQAGEAVISANAMRGIGRGAGGHTLNVHPGAVTITVQGSMDQNVAEQVKRHVERQFDELHRQLRGMGR